MDIEVKRVWTNDVDEHQDVIRSAFIIPETIVKAEQSMNDETRTDLLMSYGEMTINEDVHSFKKRVDKYISDENEKRREENKKDSLGL